ncbi:MAG: hypothetical protein AMXMBFR49_10100 [Chlorobiota bacterium]|nr:MAG: hypothetical protein EDM75_01840 [Chlorobiota bacterium]
MGKTVNNTYELLEQLGQGGMGVVYKARHIHFKEIVAIKRLWEQFSNDPMVLDLFLNEGIILRKLHHQNIVQVSDLFEFEGSHYIVMEYIEGRTLSDIIRRETGPIRRERAISLFKQMLEGVAYIHSQPKPIIHRDLKPLNILVTSDDTVKITDFGIAKALDAGGHSTTVKGTPVYMSPEQIINPKTVDIRTDVYSLGMTFYEMLCAKTPFHGDTTTTPTAVYAAIMNGEVPPPTLFYPGIPDELSALVMKAVHKDRNQRFADASEMLGELEKLEMSGATTVQGTIKTAPPVVSKPDPVNRNDDNKSKSDLVLPIEKGEVKKDTTFIRWLTASTIMVITGFILLSGNLSKIFRVQSESEQASMSSLQHNTPEMTFVAGGTFPMGSYDGDSDEKPSSQVTVSSFMISKTEVTQALWESVMGNNPSNFKGSNRPVEKVSWYDAVEFCNMLSEKEGLQTAYTGSGDNIHCDFTVNGYRLPTEAEWEYAARGGNKSRGYKYSGSNEIGEVAWYGGWNKSGNRLENDGTSKVGTKQPNELGIFDMSGNVHEWCWDWFGVYSSESRTNPQGATSGSNRVLRGGSWLLIASYCRFVDRGGNDPDFRNYDLGFRLVRTR